MERVAKSSSAYLTISALTFRSAEPVGRLFSKPMCFTHSNCFQPQLCLKEMVYEDSHGAYLA